MVYRVYVGGLNASIEKRDLQELFERYGQPLIWVARSPPGFAFVEIHDKHDAEDAIKDLDGTEFRGVRLKLEFAKDSSTRPRGPDRDRDRDRYSSSSSRYDDRYSSSRYDDRDRYSSSSSRYDDRRYPATTYHDERRGPAYGGELKCFNCNQLGHYARDCPKEKNTGECYTCGKPGHQSRDCPEKGGSGSSSRSRDSRRSRSPSPRRSRSRSPGDKRRSASPRRESNGDASAAH